MPSRASGGSAHERLPALLDLGVLQKLADANYRANGMPIGIVDAIDGAILVGRGWQDICLLFHRAHPRAAERCRESDDYIKANLAADQPAEYTCKNGLRDIGIPILVDGQHLATLFLGQFFYEGETPDRALFIDQAREFGFDEESYLAALERVPVFGRREVENIVAYDVALARFIADVAEGTLRHLRAEEALREADRRKAEFLAILSHELRNPLAPICNSVYLLDRVPPGSAQAVRAREVLKRQTHHLSRLVDDLLDVIRISRGKIELRRQRIDAREVVRDICDDHRTLFQDRGVELRLDTSGPVWLDADPERLVQAVGNLLQNAAKFTRAGGSTTVVVAEEGGRARIRVRDTGVGFPAEEVERMFEPFVQAERGLARTEGGLGLGLALVKGFVELHHGEVMARSAGPGQGAEFVITLPLAPAAAADAPAPASG